MTNTQSLCFRGADRFWSKEGDRTITKLGKYLRQFRLDELPQRFNAIWGEMRLVGPRPERPYVVDLRSKDIHYHGLRHSVKPGIAGWTQFFILMGIPSRTPTRNFNMTFITQNTCPSVSAFGICSIPLRLFFLAGGDRRARC